MKPLVKYGHIRFKRLGNQLEKYGHSHNPEILHKIRVELKKIKVLFHLVLFCSNDFNEHKTHKPLRKIFRRAGEIRNSDVIHQLFIEYKVSYPKKNIVNKTERMNLITRFRKDIPRFKNTIKKCDEKMTKHFEELKINCFKSYLLNKERELQGKLFSKFNEKDLHNTRKLIKEVIYTSTVRKNKITPKSILFYEAAQNSIGAWHDKQTLIKVLKENAVAMDNSAFKKLKSGSVDDKKKLKNLIADFQKKHNTVYKLKTGSLSFSRSN